MTLGKTSDQLNSCIKSNFYYNNKYSDKELLKIQSANHVATVCCSVLQRATVCYSSREGSRLVIASCLADKYVTTRCHTLLLSATSLTEKHCQISITQQSVKLFINTQYLLFLLFATKCPVNQMSVAGRLQISVTSVLCTTIHQMQIQ